MMILNMRKLIFLFCSILFFSNCFSQDRETDSLILLLKKTKEDSASVDILNKIAVRYLNTSPDTTIIYATQAKQLAENISYIPGLAYALKNIGLGYYMQANYIQTLTYWNKSLEKFQDAGDKKGIANILSNLGAVYYNQGDDAKALDYYLKALQFAEETKDTLRIVTTLNNIGAVYFNRKDSHEKALDYYLKALPLGEAIGDDDIGTILVNMGEIYYEKNDDTLSMEYFEKAGKYGDVTTYSLNGIAKVYARKKDYPNAIKYHQQALDIATKVSGKLEMSQSYRGLAETYLQINNVPKALENYKNAEQLAKDINANYELEKIYKGLSDAYAKINNYPVAYKYQLLLTAIKDTLYNTEKDKKLALLQFNFEIQKKQTEIDLLTKDKTLKDLDLKTQKTVRNSLIAVLSLVILLVFILFRNYRIKDKTNALLDGQKKELERTLAELKTMQTQLIQSEKMASLGELTAGIAHEIQNPLNFVNNFSEVSSEMLDEMKMELSTGNIEQATGIADEVQRNLEKILYHGRRADAIVKGMLQHSRTSVGKKEPTDINALANEYLRLAFHGLRAKDKSFNAEIKTYFDKNIISIKIVPQDVGRVLLNLFHNAFYAVSEKQKAKSTTQEDYKPIVSVTTQKINFPSGEGGVEIKVEDNGNGIPQKIVDKIFQPFFTTKPAGQGTGLGLSLAYDIIVKEYNGTIKVESKEGEGTKFVISLPMA